MKKLLAATADRAARYVTAIGDRRVAPLPEDTARLEALGGRKVNPPSQIMEGLRSVYLQDPDGNWIELDEDRVHAEAQFLVWQRTAIAPAPGVVKL